MVVPIRRAAPAEPDAKVTYGMCGTCLEAALAALAPRRRRTAAAAR